MKFKALWALGLLMAAAISPTGIAAQELGAPDTVALVASVTPDAAGGEMHLQLDLWVFNDSNDVYGATMGFIWDNPSLQMDSAVPTSVATMFEIGPFFFEDDDINLTNANRRFLFGGSKIFGTGVSPADTRRLWASYYFTLSSWTVTDSIVIDTSAFSSSTVYKFVGGQGVGNYYPYFTGKLVIHDPDYVEPVNLVVNPDSLHFSGIEGGSNPPGQTFEVATDGDPVFFQLNEDADWLIVTPIQGNTVQTINVSVNTIGAPAGSYKDSIEVTSAGASNSPQYVVVTLDLEPPAPEIAVDPDVFYFNAIAGGDNPAPKTLTITNVSASVLNWAVSNGESWLSLAPTSGTDSGDVTLTVDITGLAYDEYYDTIVVSDPAASNNPVRVPVNLSVGSDLPIIETDSAGYTIVVGVPVDSIPDRTIEILNGGAGTLNFWLEENTYRIIGMDPDSGTAPQAVDIRFKIPGGSAGNDYYDTIWVHSNEAINSPYPVELHFIYRDNPAHLGVSVDSIGLPVYECSMGWLGITPARTFTVTNYGGDNPMPIQIIYESDYFTVSPDTATNAGAFTVASNFLELPAGVYEDTLMIVAPNADNSPRLVPVYYIVQNPTQTPQVYLPIDSYVIPTQENTGPTVPAAMEIWNRYGGCMEWELADSIPWLYPGPLSGNVPATVDLSVNSSGFPFGEYQDTLLIVAPTASNNPKKVSIKMRVWRFHGDNNYDSEITIADLVYLVDYMFNSGPRPQPELHVGDLTCDLLINIDDLVYMVDYMFLGGPIPCGNPYK